MSIQPSAIAGTAKTFILAHPIGIAMVGGALVGTGSYFLLKKYLNKDEAPAATAESA